MTARAWRDRRDSTWRYYLRSVMLGPPPAYEATELLVGAREGHIQVFDRRIRTQLLRRDRRAARHGRLGSGPSYRQLPDVLRWALPDADPAADLRAGWWDALRGEQPQRAVLARSQLERLLPALDEAGVLDA